RALRVLFLRSLRVVKRHHFSLVSGAVLTGALLVAMTSSALETGNGPAPEPQAVATAAPEASPMPTATGPAAADSTWRTIVYYIVESDAQAAQLYSARRGDLLYMEALGLPLPRTQVQYLQFDSAQEEVDTQRLLYELSTVAHMFQVEVKVVDLRR